MKSNGGPRIQPLQKPFTGYRTHLGRYWNAEFEVWLKSRYGRELDGEASLILTSPPFPLSTKKSYGNLTGADYIAWLRGLAPHFFRLLSEDGSLVIEIGNAWNPGQATMSTLPIEALLAIKEEGGFHLCQEFVCHNPARLPSPAQYVNVERSRLKDSWTRIWWLSRTHSPKADNRKVLIPYSAAMQRLLKSQKYNAGRRPSEHVIGAKSFLKDNGGSIPASCLTAEVVEHFGNLIITGNTKSSGDPYLSWCRKHEVAPHPARMPDGLVAFFISFLTSKDDLVLDPFAGSNTTGSIAQLLGRRWASIEANSINLEPSMARFHHSPTHEQSNKKP